MFIAALTKATCSICVLQKTFVWHTFTHRYRKTHKLQLNGDGRSLFTEFPTTALAFFPWACVCVCVSNKRSVTVFASLSYSCWFGLKWAEVFVPLRVCAYLQTFKELAISASPCKCLPGDLLNVGPGFFQIWDVPALFEDKAAAHFMRISQKLTSRRSRVWSSARRFLLWEATWKTSLETFEPHVASNSVWHVFLLPGIFVPFSPRPQAWG